MTETEKLIEAEKKKFRRLSKPLCPHCQIVCKCECTKTGPEYITQYRYCPACRHSVQTVIPK